MNYSDDEIIALLNRLLEKLHQAGGKNQGSIVVNIYKEGSHHIDHVDNQYFYGSPTPTPQKDGEKGTDAKSQLPEELRTEEAMKLWKIAQDAGYVDENFQPLISRTQAALLALVMAERLDIREKWKVNEIESPREHPFNYEGIYAQAYALYQQSFRNVRGYVVVRRSAEEMKAWRCSMAQNTDTVDTPIF